RNLLLRHEGDHRVERAEVHVRMNLDRLVRRRVRLPDADDVADRDTARIQRRVLLRTRAGGDDHVALLYVHLLRHAVEDELSLALADTHETKRTAVLVERGDGAGVVRDERDLRRTAVEVGDATDEPIVRHDRRVLPDAAARARGDDDLLIELARRARDDSRGDRRVVRREAGAVDVVQEIPELDVLLVGGLVLDHLL